MVEPLVLGVDRIPPNNPLSTLDKGRNASYIVKGYSSSNCSLSSVRPYLLMNSVNSALRAIGNRVSTRGDGREKGHLPSSGTGFVHCRE